tara:strand:- start:663 stop:1022 length:360 start_codon:yes stop_codon:yes gene_type:complete
MENKEIKKPEAWIELRQNEPAYINLFNSGVYVNASLDSPDDSYLYGFEWNVYTVKKRYDGRYAKCRIFVGFKTYKDAEKYTKDEGYEVLSQDISAALYQSIKYIGNSLAPYGYNGEDED